MSEWKNSVCSLDGAGWRTRSFEDGDAAEGTWRSRYLSVRPSPAGFHWSAASHLIASDSPRSEGVASTIQGAEQAADIALDQLMAEGH